MIAKRSIDIVVSFTGLLLLLIPFLFIAIAIVLFIGGNPLFTQQRLGKNHEVFRIYKFKTLSNKRTPKGDLLPDILRATRFGSILRNYSVDELPQLANVLLGSMSLVGPRPLLVEYGDKYNDYQDKRHLVRPGITGWNQINGRDSLSWEDKFDNDVWYVRNQSFSLDIKILWITMSAVIKKRGVDPKTGFTMKKFNPD